MPMQHAQYMLLFLVLAVNSDWFQILQSYTTHPFLCTLDLIPAIANNWTFNFNLQSADDVQGGTQETNSTRGSQSEESADITSPKTKTPPPKPVPFRIPSPPPTIKEGGEGEEEGGRGREKEGKEEEEGSKSEFLTMNSEGRRTRKRNEKLGKDKRTCGSPG